jgi:hypothetical protein
MLIFAIASAGMTVFAPLPVKPPTNPFASSVGRLPARARASWRSSPSSALAPVMRRTSAAYRASFFFHSSTSSALGSRTAS